MTEQELYNEYRKSDCKSFTDFLINKITELKKTYSKQRNKRIDELQKENARLTTNEKSLIAERKIIVKENAELKGLVNQYKASKCGSISLVNRNMIMFDQLTKAKEYIKLLLMNCVGVYESTGKTIAEIQAEAEQFLSEVEK